MSTQLEIITHHALFQLAIQNDRKLTDNTNEVSNGDIFVLRQGERPLSPQQAADLCQKAQAAGACALIADPSYALSVDVPLLPLSSPHRHLQPLAQAFYGNASKTMQMIAVTGTNGKTTTTYLMESIAKNLNIPVGVLGTISYRYPGYEEASVNTTPGLLKLYRLLKKMSDAHCRLVVMEVSSHAIVQGRIDGILWDAAIWNNLGTDHLDYHKTQEAYACSKQRLFDHYLPESWRAGKQTTAIANADDPVVMRHILAAHPETWGNRVLSFSANGEDADLTLRSLQWQSDRWQFSVNMEDKSLSAQLPLVGKYNAANAAAALTAMYALGYPLEALTASLTRVAQIPGRMECVHSKPLVTVDFAHTPEALENALKAARQCVDKNGRLLSVFGAGGDRDPSKRPTMGRISADLADVSYITSDNPRTESPESIIGQIVSGMPENASKHVEINRKLAIEAALTEARENDCVLIAGKGHEDYQILGTTKIHFDDREEVLNFFKKTSNPTPNT